MSIYSREHYVEMLKENVKRLEQGPQTQPWRQGDSKTPYRDETPEEFARRTKQWKENLIRFIWAIQCKIDEISRTEPSNYV